MPLVDTEHFKASEFTCKCGCGANETDQRLVDMLERARTIAGIPFYITSGTRCVQHNRNVGGSPISSHLFDKSIGESSLAADIAIESNKNRFIILSSLLSVGFKRIGISRSFIHADVDNKKPTMIIWLYPIH